MFVLQHPGVWLYDCLHYDLIRLSDGDHLQRVLQHDLDRCGLRPRDLKDNLMIVSFLGEGITAEMSRPLVATLRGRGAKVAGLFQDHGWHFVDFPWASVPGWGSVNSPWFDNFVKTHGTSCWPRTTHVAICLNRRHSQVRSTVIQHLMRSKSANRVIMSLKSNLSPTHIGSIHADGVLTDDRLDDAPDPKLLGAAVKIITEGNEQGIPGHAESLLITEKTFKCFAWRQLPIWVSYPGTVSVVRDLGFDVFDDVFDGHQYDDELDQDARIIEVMRLYEDRIARLHLSQLARMRQNHKHRLDSNFQRLRYWVRRSHDIRHQAIKNFTKMFVENHDFRV